VADDEDNCPDEPNADQADHDDDGVGNACDPQWRSGEDESAKKAGSLGCACRSGGGPAVDAGGGAGMAGAGAWAGSRLILLGLLLQRRRRRGIARGW